MLLAVWQQCWCFGSTITLLLFLITFGFFFFSPRMPSCSSSLLARALSDTNTIGWHVGNGSGWKEERGVIRDRKERVNS